MTKTVLWNDYILMMLWVRDYKCGKRKFIIPDKVQGHPLLLKEEVCEAMP